MLNSKYLYISILAIAFIYHAFRSYFKILEEQTTFEETELKYAATFPSVTFCLRLPLQDNYTTFEDLTEDVEGFKGYFQIAQYKIFGKGVTRIHYDLKNSTVLENIFNSSLDHVWESSAMLMPGWYFSIVPCITLNIPFLGSPKRGRHQFYVKIAIPKSRKPKPLGINVLKHEYKQSTHTYDMDTSVSYQTLDLPNQWKTEYLIQTETLSLKKQRYDCVEDNSMHFKDCMDEFIGEQLNCNLPWAENPKIDYQECQSQEHLKAYRNISLNMDSEEIKAKIEQKGCFVPNCKKTTWVKNQFNYKKQQGKEMRYFISIPSTMKILQRKEVKITDFNTFVADFGGYLGLFLGASVLSLTNFALTNLKKASKWFSSIFNKAYNF